MCFLLSLYPQRDFARVYVMRTSRIPLMLSLGIKHPTHRTDRVQFHLAVLFNITQACPNENGGIEKICRESGQRRRRIKILNMQMKILKKKKRKKN